MRSDPWPAEVSPSWLCSLIGRDSRNLSYARLSGSTAQDRPGVADCLGKAVYL